MKTMKKFSALFLALVLVLAMVVMPASAADPLAAKGNITIKNSANGETYTLYRIFDLAATDGAQLHRYITNTDWAAFSAGAAKDDGFILEIDTEKYITPATDFNTAEKAQAFATLVANNANSMTFTNTRTQGTATSDTLTFTDMQYGYYVMISSRGDKYTTFTLCSNAGITIEEKNEALPLISKQVKEDSTSTYGDTNTAAFEDTMSFKITVTVTAGTDTYTLVDEMSGLSFVSITSVKRTSDGNSTDLSDSSYTATSTTNGFTLVFTDTERQSWKDDDIIEIIYTGKLTSTATVGSTGNENLVKLYYEGKSTDGTTDKTASTLTYTYALTVKKIDQDGNALAGAGFTLYTDADCTNAFTSNEIITDTTGEFVINGLDTDTYYLKETTVPAGYTGAVVQNVPIVAGENTVTVKNIIGTELPPTGGIGTPLFYTIGGILVLAALAVLISKKRAGAAQ